ncbi:MAG: OmpH family outer membrane protein [Proteiniphilum sp.]|jgi:outer membrane protein|nr:OmpH family outer membrane protein [Proteiniphilum sp.]
MKNSSFYIAGGVLTVAIIVLYILLFTYKSSVKGNAERNLSSLLSDSSVTLPIGYVNVDSLLMNYNFAKDLNESLLRKQESTRATLNQKEGQVRSAAADFERRLRNNAFLSEEKAQQEQTRILQMDQEYQQLAERLTQEFMLEQEKMNIQMEDTIKARMKEFNLDKNYEIIFSNRTTSTILFADKKYDITRDVIDFLNGKYAPVSGN